MKPMKFVYPIDSGNLLEAGEASSRMKQKLKRLGLPADVIRRAAICMYEGEINMVIHANGGVATVEVTLDEIRIRLEDQGPGIPDVAKAMEEGYSTASAEARNLGFGAGMGLPNMKRYADQLEIDTTLGVGTVVSVTIQM